MDFLKKLDTLKSVVEENPLDSLKVLELPTTISKNVAELAERLEALEKKVG